jgi:hypothetical protein
LELNRTAEAEQHLQTSQRLTAAGAEILHIQSQLARHPVNRAQALRLVELYEETGQPQLADHWRRVALQSP